MKKKTKRGPFYETPCISVIFCVSKVQILKAGKFAASGMERPQAKSVLFFPTSDQGLC